MSNEEFELLDELYFIQPFDLIQNSLGWDEDKLKDFLLILINKKWIKCFFASTKEIVIDEELDFLKDYKEYFYLATKEGLMAHNSN